MAHNPPFTRVRKDESASPRPHEPSTTVLQWVNGASPVGFPGGASGKESICNAGGLSWIPGSGRFPKRRAWQPTPLFFPGESQGQRRLADATAYRDIKSQA